MRHSITGDFFLSGDKEASLEKAAGSKLSNDVKFTILEKQKFKIGKILISQFSATKYWLVPNVEQPQNPYASCVRHFMTGAFFLSQNKETSLEKAAGSKFAPGNSSATAP